jgi:AraC-like DNA-binding protein
MLREERGTIVNSQNAPLFIRHVRECGGDADALIHRFGLPTSIEASSAVALPIATLHRLGEACASAVGDPFFGVNAALRAPRGAFGLLEFVCRNNLTLGAALQRLVEYYPLLNEVDRLEVSTRHGEWALWFSVPGEPVCWGRHFNECSLVLLCRMAREASGDRFKPRRLWFAHASPNDVGAIHEAVGTAEVTFGTSQNGLAIAKEHLQLPFIAADAALLKLLDDQARERLEAQPVVANLENNLRAVIRRELKAGPRVERVAAQLCMSTRTLQRRLSADGTSFQRLVEEVRHEYARTLLIDSREPIKVIASLLGYSDTRAFTRAYKRAMGETPVKTRLAARGSPVASVAR